ncbi:hypothetical protein A5N15_03400 [Rothia kristinae]|uniref:Uncharacterized protein n=1 Tax=Rothia kristinae TaxID=37923 RepID=A0A199PS85_9MICC|nr:hypothetical protein [Rothia kristinae]MBG7586661.1 hypothetical protein [Rothia kristinae]MCA1169728.1 hypothetical protein [Rothia kristinae]MED6047139.1 hypothetical protein [Rothia kristinae]OAX52558.1 hypothetical protein AN277_0202860 [Rothia kristinae]OAX64049.1 hypothetical protein A5N15_03400 [Rothia kristinae]
MSAESRRHHSDEGHRPPQETPRENAGHNAYDFLDGSSGSEFMTGPNVQRREPEGRGALFGTIAVLVLAVVVVLVLILR